MGCYTAAQQRKLWCAECHPGYSLDPGLGKHDPHRCVSDTVLAARTFAPKCGQMFSNCLSVRFRQSLKHRDPTLGAQVEQACTTGCYSCTSFKKKTTAGPGSDESMILGGWAQPSSVVVNANGTTTTLAPELRTPKDPNFDVFSRIDSSACTVNRDCVDHVSRFFYCDECRPGYVLDPTAGVHDKGSRCVRLESLVASNGLANALVSYLQDRAALVASLETQKIVVRGVSQSLKEVLAFDARGRPTTIIYQPQTSLVTAPVLMVAKNLQAGSTSAPLVSAMPANYTVSSAITTQVLAASYEIQLFSPLNPDNETHFYDLTGGMVAWQNASKSLWGDLGMFYDDINGTVPGLLKEIPIENFADGSFARPRTLYKVFAIHTPACEKGAELQGEQETSAPPSEVPSTNSSWISAVATRLRTAGSSRELSTPENAELSVLSCGPGTLEYYGIPNGLERFDGPAAPTRWPSQLKLIPQSAKLASESTKLPQEEGASGTSETTTSASAFTTSSATAAAPAAPPAASTPQTSRFFFNHDRLNPFLGGTTKLCDAVWANCAEVSANTTIVKPNGQAYYSLAMLNVTVEQTAEEDYVDPTPSMVDHCRDESCELGSCKTEKVFCSKCARNFYLETRGADVFAKDRCKSCGYMVGGCAYMWEVLGEILILCPQSEKVLGCLLCRDRGGGCLSVVDCSQSCGVRPSLTCQPPTAPPAKGYPFAP